MISSNFLHPAIRDNKKRYAALWVNVMPQILSEAGEDIIVFNRAKKDLRFVIDYSLFIALTGFAVAALMA